MNTRISRNKSRTGASARLEEREGDLWIVLETPFNVSGSPQAGSGLRQWFRIEAPDAAPTMLAGRAVRRLDAEEGLFVDEEGNSYRLAGGARAEPVFTEVILAEGEIAADVPGSAKGRR